jgi:micrococcal nuclease
VARGYARTLTIPPNVAHADEFARLARGAREAGRGLWRDCQ